MILDLIKSRRLFFWSRKLQRSTFASAVSLEKKRFAIVLQKENALFILNSSSHILFVTYKFEPNCENLTFLMKFSTWRAFVALSLANWLKLHYFVLLSAVYDIKYIDVTYN